MKHDQQPFLKTHRANIDKLSHDGRGIARIEGKTTFITGALAGEDVYTRQKKTFDEGEVVTPLNASPDRTMPPCAHADRCGGCSLQYMTHAAQVRHKQDVLSSFSLVILSRLTAN